MKSLQDKKIAIIATDGFERSELFEPLKALLNAGAQCHVISPKKGMIQGWEKGRWSDTIRVDCDFSEASAEIYDGLLIPGGVINSDKIRTEASAVNFVTDFFDQKKPVAAICHGPQLLIEADVVKQRTMTSYKSIKTDLENAGAQWVDRSVVVDNGLVTSRDPNDLPDFTAKMIEEFGEGKHSMQHA